MNDKIKIILGWVLFAFICSIPMYLMYQENNKCETIVTLKDGNTIRCNRATTTDGGMVHIRTCDSRSIQIPITEIEIIKSIKH